MANKLTQIQNMIYEIRGQKVMLDRDLAALYEVETKYLKRTVKRNMQRFPVDFMFQLTQSEFSDLRCQIDTSSWGGSRYLPYAFTEQGIAMLSGLLNSEIAVNVNIQIMRAFVKLRHYVLSQNKDDQIAELRKLLMVYIENTDYKLSKHDKEIEQIIIALNNLIEKPPKTRRIGFNTDN
jgi:hypothetical protein